MPLGRARDRSRGRPAARAASAPAYSPADLAPVLWSRADLGITLNGGDVSAWADQGSTAPVLDFAQGTAANQALYSASVAALNNQSALTAGNSDWMQAGAAGDVNFVHAGTGCTIAMVCRPAVMGTTQYLLSSQGTSLTALGFAIYVQNTDRVNFVTGNGTGSPIALMSSSAVALNTAFLLEIEYATASTPDCAMFLNGAAVGTTSDAVAPSSSNSATALRLATAAATFAFSGDYAEILILSRVWTGAERTAFRSYVASRYALAV